MALSIASGDTTASPKRPIAASRSSGVTRSSRGCPLGRHPRRAETPRQSSLTHLLVRQRRFRPVVYFPSPSPSLVGGHLAREFAVLSQLALRGIDANMTLGHTKGVDILASDQSTGKMFKIEVKTSLASKPSHSKLFGHGFTWIMGDKHEAISDLHLFYCFVNIEKEANSFRFFIVPSQLVTMYVARVRVHHTAPLQFWLLTSFSSVQSLITLFTRHSDATFCLSFNKTHSLY